MEYLTYLFEQFRMAYNLKSADIKSPIFLSDFLNWLNSMYFIALKYIEFLDFVGIDYKDKNTYEIGKGKFDSVVKPYNTSIITPYAYNFKIDKKRIINAKFDVYNNLPILVRSVSEYASRFEFIKYNTPYNYMVNNPYTNEHILNFDKLHNSGNGNIIVGVYGSIYDNDMASKIKKLKVLRNKLDYSYKEEMASSDGNYYYVLTSSRCIKK